MQWLQKALLVLVLYAVFSKLFKYWLWKQILLKILTYWKPGTCNLHVAGFIFQVALAVLHPSEDTYLCKVYVNRSLLSYSLPSGCATSIAHVECNSSVWLCGKMKCIMLSSLPSICKNENNTDGNLVTRFLLACNSCRIVPTVHLVKDNIYRRFIM